MRREEQVTGNNQKGSSSDFDDFNGFWSPFSFFRFVGSGHLYLLRKEMGVCKAGKDYLTL